jgi:phage transcriptional repressor|nr:MAG TPA: Repressor protein CI [Caudoviricetes sp.]
MSISKRIKNRRQELGMSVEELADILNKNKATIYRYENGDIGKVPYNILEPLSEALDVSIGYLLGSEDTFESGYDTKMKFSGATIVEQSFLRKLEALYRENLNFSDYRVVEYDGEKPLDVGWSTLFINQKNRVVITDLENRKELETNQEEYYELLNRHFDSILKSTKQTLVDLPGVIYDELMDDKNNTIKENTFPYTTVYAIEKVSAGLGYRYGENEATPYYTNKSKLKQYDFATKVRGNSMEPEYYDGDIVLVKSGYDNVNGDVYVVDYAGESYIKKLYNDGDRFRLVSINDKYDNIIINVPISDDIYFNIAGKVVDSFTPIEI